MLEKMGDNLNSSNWIDYLQPLMINMLLAVIIFFIGIWLVQRFISLVDKLMQIRNVDKALSGFLHTLLGTLLRFIVFLIALEQMGVETTSLLALLGAAGLAVGLALKDSLSNFASGILLILLKPFKIGDVIEAAGVMAIVDKITIFHTILKTGDNREVIVPNSQIYSGTITNYSARPTRRIDLTVGIGYNDDIKHARNIIMQVINGDMRIHKDPAPVIAVDELGESSVNFVVRVWVKSEEYWDVRWQLLETIKTSFDANGVTIPYPQRDVHLYRVN